MPVLLNSNRCLPDRPPAAQWLGDRPHAKFQELSSRCITIGLINNMPDGALEATERQFLALLDAASDGILIRLSLHSLPGVPRNEAGARHVQEFYSSTENLWDTHLDGLIVTGREPMTPSLKDEPYWKSFVDVLEWARDNTHSTVWSCLAAHAAVLHMDGVARVRSGTKHCGVFDCARVSDHPLIKGAPARFSLPHSRWNGLPEEALARRGYAVLTRAAEAGVDTFVKHLNSLFVFFQGHPEYESNTLLLEYRRDVGRFLRGESESWPSMPRGYFSQRTVDAVEALRNEAMAHRGDDLTGRLSEALGSAAIENTWSATATCMYRNWLEFICARKQLRLNGGKFILEPHGVESLTPAQLMADHHAPEGVRIPA